jgi:hypothetical protein
LAERFQKNLIVGSSWKLWDAGLRGSPRHFARQSFLSFQSGMRMKLDFTMATNVCWKKTRVAPNQEIDFRAPVEF